MISSYLLVNSIVTGIQSVIIINDNEYQYKIELKQNSAYSKPECQRRYFTINDYSFSVWTRNNYHRHSRGGGNLRCTRIQYRHFIDK